MTTSEPIKPPYPYAHASRLAPTGPIEAAALTRFSGPLEIEIGPGRGSFIVERAKERPEAQVVGLEIRWKWATLVDERLTRLGMGERARVYAEDARSILPRLEPSGCVDAFFIHFPDPWWKKRQQKRLVVSVPFISEMVRLLRPGGFVLVQTDVPERAEAYETLLAVQTDLVADGDAAGSAHLSHGLFLAKSNRERRCEEAGVPITRLRYRRR